MASTQFSAERENVGKSSAQLRVPAEKRLEMRARRIEGTVERVRQGKHR